MLKYALALLACVAASGAVASGPPDPKVAQMHALVAAQNGRSLDFYGRVIDQFGHPVADAWVTGTLMTIQGVDVGTQKRFYTTQSDANGNFAFTGLIGWQLGVVVSKPGYEMKQGAGFYEPPNKADVTSPGQRALFRMWKLKGPEPMAHTRIEAGIRCDGIPRHFDLLSGRRDAGDLTVTLTRTPVNIEPGRPFSWTLSLSIPGGGLVPVTDLYPNEAPDRGYQTVSMHMPVDAKNWSASAIQTYYVYDGKHYGRLAVNVMADYQPPPTHIEFEAFINPSGSRNLEYDPAKAITPK